MEKLLNELISLAEQYKEYGTSIRFKEDHTTLVGRDARIKTKSTNIEVAVYFTNNYKTFSLTYKKNHSELNIAVYAKHFKLPFGVNEQFIKTAIEDLSVGLIEWKNYNDTVLKEELEAERLQEIEALQERLKLLTK